jgi:hypothetical protein
MFLKPLILFHAVAHLWYRQTLKRGATTLTITAFSIFTSSVIMLSVVMCLLLSAGYSYTDSSFCMMLGENNTQYIVALCFVMLGVAFYYYYNAECWCAECPVFLLLCWLSSSLSVCAIINMLCVVMLSVIMLNVAAPRKTLPRLADLINLKNVLVLAIIF